MADITSINAAGSTAGVPPVRPARVQAQASSPESTDRVEISDLARLLSGLDLENQAQARAQKVADIREAIAQGTYETDDKIDYVVSRLMEALQESPEQAVAS